MAKFLSIILLLATPAFSLPTQQLPSDGVEVAPFILGGSEVAPNSLPYQAFISIEFSASGTWCGASIISRNYLLTAKHCVYNPPQSLRSVTVRLGTHRLDTTIAGSVTQSVPGSNVQVHNSIDVALIRLAAQISYTNVIQPIRLPQSAEWSLSYAGYSGTVSGWGLSEIGYPQALRSVTMNVMTQSGCREFFWNIESHHICLEGTNGRSPCFGDSGGPLVVRNTVGQWTQVGVASFVSGYGCSVGHPSVFVRVTSIADWIRTNSDVSL